MRDRLTAAPARTALHLSVYLVTDAVRCGARGVESVVADAIDGGVSVVQLRDKTADASAFLRQLERLSSVVDGRAALLVNDRLDIALAARAYGLPVDGVHLGQGDAAVSVARDRLGPEAIVGLTASSEPHLAAVRRMPRGTVDYLGVGVIRATSTKPDHAPVIGVAGFARIAAAAELPCVAIGGITHADVPALRKARAAGVAVVSAVCGATDPRGAAARFAAAWRSG
ncbi:thiamine phosphate synthase [Agromyces sp. SYSU K20354]|uniref:thiamine phosphate synthase n=1 Tax=Agromyces cavernae TaxID=2898659 RepID=UPI001E3E93E1|nr:thiamine phosphate synthase [Agromyces cavernae]MCD2443440.1 thiamine phosphate synthase [Agromyces cavernae]